MCERIGLLFLSFIFVVLYQYFVMWQESEIEGLIGQQEHLEVLFRYCCGIIALFSFAKSLFIVLLFILWQFDSLVLVKSTFLLLPRSRTVPSL